jgi:hypothetical protein
LTLAFDFGHKRKKGGAVRGIGPRPSEGVSRAIPRRQSLSPVVLKLTWTLKLAFGFDFDFDLEDQEDLEVSPVEDR